MTPEDAEAALTLARQVLRVILKEREELDRRLDEAYRDVLAASDLLLRIRGTLPPKEQP
jgi:hypothetical protein